MVSFGTPVFMATELLVDELRLKHASLSDLKRADIWAYGMVVFNVINPGLKYPYEQNVKSCKSVDGNPLNMLTKFVRENKKPEGQEKYATYHQQDWARAPQGV